MTQGEGGEAAGGLPTWAWWLFGIVGVLLAVLVTVDIANATPEEKEPLPQPTEVASPSPTPSVTPSASPSPSESSSPSETPSPTPTAEPSDSPTPMPSPTDVPTLPSSFDPGRVVIGKDAAPGTYRVDAEVNGACVWALKAKDATTLRSIQSTVIRGGEPTVTLVDGDTFASKGCGSWTAVDPAALFANAQAAVTAGPGVWLVGEDIKPGTWATGDLGSSPKLGQLCTWRVTESIDDNFATVVARDLVFSGSGRVVLTAGQQFESTNCGDWTLLTK
jgi:hypothetical protein